MPLVCFPSSSSSSATTAAAAMTRRNKKKKTQGTEKERICLSALLINGIYSLHYFACLNSSTYTFTIRDLPDHLSSVYIYDKRPLTASLTAIDAECKTYAHTRLKKGHVIVFFRVWNALLLLSLVVAEKEDEILEHKSCAS